MKIKYRLLSAKLESLKKEHEISKDIFQEAKSEFMKEMLQMVTIVEDSPEDPPPKDGGPESIKEKEDTGTPEQIIKKHSKEGKDDDLKRIFRQIVKETHPDLLHDKTEFERDRKKDLFARAKCAIEEDDFLELSHVAKELGIDPPIPTKKHLSMLESTIEKLNKELNNMTRTYFWLWYHEDDADKRREFMMGYIERIRT